MGNLHPGVSGNEYVLCDPQLPQKFHIFQVTWQAGGFSCSSLQSKKVGMRLEAAWDVGAAEVTRGWRRERPVIFLLLSFFCSPSQNYPSVWCCWRWYPRAQGILVPCPTRGQTRRGNRKTFCWGRSIQRVGGCEFEDANPMRHLPFASRFTKNTRVYWDKLKFLTNVPCSSKFLFPSPHLLQASKKNQLSPLPSHPAFLMYKQHLVSAGYSLLTGSSATTGMISWYKLPEWAADSWLDKRPKGSFLPHEPGGCTKYFDIVLRLIAKAPVNNPLLYLMCSFLVIPGWQDYGGWRGGWKRPKGREGGGRKIGELESPVSKGAPSRTLCPCSLISCPASPKLHF